MIIGDKDFVGYAITPGVVNRLKALEEMLYYDLAYDTTYALLTGWSIEGIQEYERTYGTDELLVEIERIVYGLSDERVAEIYEEVVALHR